MARNCFLSEISGIERGAVHWQDDENPVGKGGEILKKV